MDYGKLAYLKAEDIETRLNSGGYKFKTVQKNVTIGRTLRADEPVILAEIRAQNAAALLVCINLAESETAFGLGENYGRLLLDGRVAAEQILAASMTFTVPVEAGLGAKISFAASCGVKAVLCQAMLMGEAEFTEGARVKHMAAGFDDAVGLVKVSGGEISVSISQDIKNQAFLPPLLLGFGFDADIVCTVFGGKNCFMTVHCDAAGNVFLNVISASGTSYKREFAGILKGISASRVSLNRSGGELGFVDGKTAYVASLNGLFPDDIIKVDAADSITLVKDSSPPVAVIERNGANYIKVAGNELLACEILNVFCN